MTTNLCGTRVRLPPSGACAEAASTPTGTAESTNTLSPQITGVPEPRPGISTFHRMFLVSLHSTGGSAVFDTPVAYGPRHWAQYFSASVSAVAFNSADPAMSADASPYLISVLRPPSSA